MIKVFLVKSFSYYFSYFYKEQYIDSRQNKSTSRQKDKTEGNDCSQDVYIFLVLFYLERNWGLWFRKVFFYYSKWGYKVVLV